MNRLSPADLSLGRWLSRGWSTFTSRPAPLIGASLILNLVASPSVVLMLDHVPAWGWAAWAVSMLLVYPVLLIGWCALLLKAVRGRDAAVGDLVTGLSRLGPSWGTGVLVTVLTFVGSALFVVPGIILWCRYVCALFAVTDRRLSPTEALNVSGRITAGHRGKLFGVWCLNNVLGVAVIAFIRAWQSNAGEGGPALLAMAIVIALVSVVIVEPWTCAANAVAYEDLVSLHDAEAVSGP